MFKKDIAFIALKFYIIQINEQGFTLMCKQLSEGRTERKTLRLTKMSFVSKCTVQITTHFIQNHLHMIFISLKIAMIQQVYAFDKPAWSKYMYKQEFDDTFVLPNKMISNTNGSVC